MSSVAIGIIRDEIVNKKDIVPDSLAQHCHYF